MDLFPAVEPIPLPAPVWLFKLLQTATLALHFGSVYILIGGLAAATWWWFRGRMRRDPDLLNASGAISARLPIVMAFVVNLGIPPLLFAQVLYGRALYTSSILIGAWWMGVVFMLMASYYLLYRMAAHAHAGRFGGWVAVLSMGLVLLIAHVFSSNMSLMLRPEAWLDMYRSDALGTTLPAGDPTAPWRWGFMVLGGGAMGGVGLAWLGQHPRVEPRAAALLRRSAGRFVVLFSGAQLLAGLWLYQLQPAAVQSGLLLQPLYVWAASGWACLTVILMALGSGLMATSSGRSLLWPSLLGTAMLLNLFCITVIRDGLRDVTLRLAGLEVWDRAVYANWPTIALFLVLFVAAGGVLGWLARVMYIAKGDTEQYA